LIAELVHLRADVRRLKLQVEESQEGSDACAEGAEKEGSEDAEAVDDAGWCGGRSFRSSLGARGRGLDLSTEDVGDMVQQLEQVVNRSVEESEEMQRLLARQEQAEEREKALLEEIDALKQECESLQQHVAELEEDVAHLSTGDDAKVAGAEGGGKGAGTKEESETLKALIEREKQRADELSRQNSQIVHKLQMEMRKKKEAEVETQKALADAARHASDAAGAHCEARGLRAELQLLRTQYETLRRREDASVSNDFGFEEGEEGEDEEEEAIDLSKAERVVARGDAEELEVLVWCMQSACCLCPLTPNLVLPSLISVTPFPLASLASRHPSVSLPGLAEECS
jgi:hypothetical protein